MSHLQSGTYLTTCPPALSTGQGCYLLALVDEQPFQAFSFNSAPLLLNFLIFYAV